jgi:hypothetical protein
MTTMFWLCACCETSNRLELAACDVCTGPRPRALTPRVTALDAARRSVASVAAAMHLPHKRPIASATRARSSTLSGESIARAARSIWRDAVRALGELESFVLQEFNRTVRDVRRLLDL